MRFTGRELDLGTGLQISRNRYLHQQLGCWITRDPLGYADGFNLYQGFIGLNRRDPFGTLSERDVAEIIGCAKNKFPGQKGNIGRNDIPDKTKSGCKDEILSHVFNKDLINSFQDTLEGIAMDIATGFTDWKGDIALTVAGILKDALKDGDIMEALQKNDGTLKSILKKLLAEEFPENEVATIAGEVADALHEYFKGEIKGDCQPVSLSWKNPIGSYAAESASCSLIACKTGTIESGFTWSLVGHCKYTCTAEKPGDCCCGENLSMSVSLTGSRDNVLRDCN